MHVCVLVLLWVFILGILVCCKYYVNDVPCTETIGEEVLLKNMLDVNINLTKVSLIWEMEQK